MKKYKLLKDIPFFKKGTIFLWDGKDAYREGEAYPVAHHPFRDDNFKSLLGIWYEEVEEIKKPKYRVGDYVVVMGDKYLKITEIYKYKDKYFYNNYSEEKLRLPTEEELEIYFR